MTGRDGDMTLGEELRAARLRKKLTQPELARKVGVKGSRWTVRRWEKDEHVPEEQHRRALIRTLSLPADFFDDVGERPAEERLSRRLTALEEAVGRIERRLFGEGASRAR